MLQDKKDEREREREIRGGLTGKQAHFCTTSNLTTIPEEFRKEKKKRKIINTS